MCRCREVWLICALSLGGLFAQAQSNTPSPFPSAATPQPDAPPSAQLWADNLGNEPVGAGDLVYVAVAGSPELSRSYRVSTDGGLTLPLLRQPIPVEGLSPSAIAQAVSDALVRERVLVAPIVSASVMEYRSRRVGVVGAVKAPTIVQAVGDVKLLDAIARAQGFSPEAGPEVIVTRPNASGASETVHIPIKELLAGNNPELNLPLHGGEEVRVPEAPKLYIVGNVKMPGIYPLNDVGGTSVMKALAISQGALRFTTRQAYVYRVVTGSETRQEIPIPLRDILHRKAPDVQLQANDILYIPENSRARLNAEVLERISGFGSTVGSGWIIWH
jgi:polysaccharide export outer membrane protein